jgi:hypothetical protein
MNPASSGKTPSPKRFEGKQGNERRRETHSKVKKRLIIHG